jgi:hypothetical protein
VTPRLVFGPEAESEILDARSCYDDQQPGLGQAFVAEVDRVLAGIVVTAYRPDSGEWQADLKTRRPRR